VSGADRAVAGPHGPWRIFAAIAATVAFPVPTIRATRLMPIPLPAHRAPPVRAWRRVLARRVACRSWCPVANPGDARGDAFLNDRGSLSIGPAPEIDLAA